MSLENAGVALFDAAVCPFGTEGPLLRDLKNLSEKIQQKCFKLYSYKAEFSLPKNVANQTTNSAVPFQNRLVN